MSIKIKQKTIHASNKELGNVLGFSLNASLSSEQLKMVGPVDFILDIIYPSNL